MFSNISNACKNNINQDLLVHRLREIFLENPVVNARKESRLKYSNKGLYFELDVWYPEHNICFEFQDVYHYVTTWYYHEYPKKIQQRDCKKRDKVHRAHITLVVVPCWWDGSSESLMSGIKFQRPDLIAELATSPFSLNPRENFFKSNEIPDVGELMYAAFPIDPNVIRSHTWWLGEKYDGIRFCWHPGQHTMYSRNGSPFSLLASVVLSLPPVFTDGEFWFGRGAFESTCALVTDDNSCVQWSLLRMIAFDMPSPLLQDCSFELRYKQLLVNTTVTHPHIIVASRFMVGRLTPLRHLLHMIIDNEGEGVILRKYESLYEHGRSLSLLKLKNSHGDREGIVVGFIEHSPQLLLPNGNILSVPLEDVKIKEIRIGDIVTFSYERVSRSDVPANPTIYRVRRDVSWDDIKYQPVADHFSLDRLFLERFAKSRGMDPLLPETWHKISSMEVSRHQRGEAILKKFKGLSQAVRSIFPEIQSNNAKFKCSWRDMKTRRAFLEDFARQHGFDPLNPENWYTQPGKRLILAKGISSIKKYHRNSAAQVILDLFPDIGLDEIKIQSKWSKRESRRRFLEAYAKQHGFDPLNATNWYSISVKKFKSYKRGGSVLNQYGGSLARALLDLFPNIGLNLRFNSSWKDTAKRRKFFEDYAKANGFDPLNPEHWYRQSILNIRESKGARSVVFYHKYSVSKALLDLFPSIGLDKSKFKKNSRM